jgi:methionyl aminopeptidase
MSILKSEQDLERLKHSCLILMSTMKLLSQNLQPGVSAGYLDKIAKEFILSHGGSPSYLGYQGFKYTLCTSINHEVCHGISPDNKIIPDNSLVKLDCGVVYEGMHSDVCVTHVVGQVDQRTQQLVRKTYDTMWAGIGSVKAGARVGDIGAACDFLIRGGGFGNVLDLGGHGVGYEVHDEPFIPHAGRRGYGPRLFENQVITIEPMLTLGGDEVVFDDTRADGWTVRTKDKSWAAQFEHTVLVTKTGSQVLTDIPENQLLGIS